MTNRPAAGQEVNDEGRKECLYSRALSDQGAQSDVLDTLPSGRDNLGGTMDPRGPDTRILFIGDSGLGRGNPSFVGDRRGACHNASRADFRGRSRDDCLPDRDSSRIDGTLLMTAPRFWDDLKDWWMKSSGRKKALSILLSGAVGTVVVFLILYALALLSFEQIVAGGIMLGGIELAVGVYEGLLELEDLERNDELRTLQEIRDELKEIRGYLKKSIPATQPEATVAQKGELEADHPVQP